MKNGILNKLLIPFILIILLVVMLLVLIQTQQNTPPAKPRIATTIGILGNIVSQIAGDEFEVYSILKPGMDPHNFEPLPQDQLQLNDSSLLFDIGLHLDDWVVELTNENSMKIIDLSLFIPADPADPHYWLSYTNTRTLARVIANELKLLKPQAEARINSNLIAFQNALDNEREYALTNLEKVKNKNIITEHNAFGYFTKDLGLQYLGALEQSHQSESEAAYYAELINLIKAYQIKTIYAEPNSQSSFVEIFAKDYGLSISYLDAEGIQYQDYLQMMRFNVDNILQAGNEGY